MSKQKHSPYFPIEFLSPIYEEIQEWNSNKTKQITKHSKTDEYTTELFIFDVRLINIVSFNDYKLDVTIDGKKDEYHVTLVSLSDGRDLLNPLTVLQFGTEIIPKYMREDEFYNTFTEPRNQTT